MTHALDKLFWHGRNLADISFSIDPKGKSIVLLSALFYKDEKAPKRERYQIKCERVSRFNCTLDATELKNNLFAGNISHAYLKENTLWIYFTDGLLEIHSKKFRLNRS